jgi:hypothetical protein
VNSAHSLPQYFRKDSKFKSHESKSELKSKSEFESNQNANSKVHSNLVERQLGKDTDANGEKHEGKEESILVDEAENSTHPIIRRTAASSVRTDLPRT